ncbi:MAG: arylamine N-acetyltransferase [Halorubrum sp. J07HR59]|nr:MAG: arylamine N-acetyltransferase [Halorubrum sp. J07HR59]
MTEEGPPEANSSIQQSRADSATAAPQINIDRYLDRIGIAPSSVTEADKNTLTRLQQAHVTTVPFENLSIVGDPFDDEPGEGVVLSIPQLFEKVVTRERGGYCFELNGLFHSLLRGLDYDIDRVPARILSDDGAGPPANHHTNIVTADREYVVDVGMGTPPMRHPTPLNGSVVTDEVGVQWRVVASDRPDETLQTEYREPPASEWSSRYVFSKQPCDIEYFRATNDHLQTAPESAFTGDPIVTIATESGYRRLSRESLSESNHVDNGIQERRRAVAPEQWHETLTRMFGISL